jgi:iron complex outermembrane receptor protein
VSANSPIVRFVSLLCTLTVGPLAHADNDAQTPADTLTPPSNPAKVVIEGKRFSDTDERRYSTAAKMVFGREELDRQGDTSVAEVLKRLPGVTISGTPGRGGDIRMRGLGKGYTMILLNGETVPRGFSLDSLSPEQVERIEIMRAPVAEHSARAIAGTINIVLREAYAKKSNEARVNLGWEDGLFQPGVSLQRNDSIGPVNYNLTANAFHKNLPSESVMRTAATDITSAAPTLLQTQRDESRAISDGIHLTGRFNWRLDGGDNLTLQPFLMQSRGSSNGITTLDQSLGATPAPYAFAHWHSDADSLMARAIVNLKLRLDDGARLELRANGGQWTSNSSTTRDQYDAMDQLVHTSWNEADIRDTTFSTSGKYSRNWQRNHQIATGWEIEAGHRQETTQTLQDGTNPLAAFGDNIGANTRRYALYVQDEWDVTPLWALYGGLRGEAIRTSSDAATNSATNTSTVLSPLFHGVWRFTQESKDQVRLGLTRSYRSPTLSDLTALPALSSNYPAAGTNTPTNADSVGNPNLKPELAWGLDLAYEHYLGAGGILSASLFRRSIDNLIRNVTSLQTVSWSPEQRWVSAPANLGSATSQGIELEAKFRLTEWFDGTPPVDFRVNFSRFWSKVDGVPGPNNRLDQQPTHTGNVGADYRLPGLPLTLGGNLNWTPAFSVRQTESQAYYQGLKRILDVYALWKITPDAQLRLSAANCLHADYQTATQELFANTDQTAATIRTTYPTFVARLELKF